MALIINNRWEEIYLNNALEDIRKEAYKEGYKIGHEEGYKIEYEIGKREAQIEVARNLIEMKFSIEDIAEITGLTADEINDL